MAERLGILFPHIFHPTSETDSLFSLWFETVHFAHLGLSKFYPQQCKSFSKLCLAVNILNVVDSVPVCKCLTPVSFFTHAFSALARGKYTDDVTEALVKLEKYIVEAGDSVQLEKKHLPCIEKLVTGDELTEKEILQVYAHHLFEPLLPNAELLVDKYIGIDASKCPFCTERKEAVKSGITSFGVSGMWHGCADIVIRNGKIQQTVTVTQGTSDGSSEPSAKRQRMDEGDFETDFDICRTGLVEVKRELNWIVTRLGEQYQDPIPQLLSQTIVNAFLVAKVNKELKNFFIPSFLVTPKGVMIVMYNVPFDSLVTQVQCHPVLDVSGKKLDKRNIFMIWLALNFDKFRLDKSVEVIKKFLIPCGFRNKANKHNVLSKYEEEVSGFVEEKQENNSRIMNPFEDREATTESFKALRQAYETD